MSYCVHCGVELDKTAKKCPLCSTPVYDPSEIPDPEAVAPFPSEKGQVEMPKRDIGILISSLVLAISGTCVLLNLFAYDSYPWSIAVIGGCVMLWIFLLPTYITKNVPVYVYLFLDGGAVLLYLWLIERMTDTDGWLLIVGIPIVIATTLAAEVLAVCRNVIKHHILSTIIEIVSTIGVYVVLLECIIDFALHGAVKLSYSAVVAVVMVVIDVAAVTIMGSKKMRAVLRKRLHL